MHVILLFSSPQNPSSDRQETIPSMVPIPIPHPHQSYITYLPETNTPTPTPVTIIIHPSIPLSPLVQRNKKPKTNSSINQSINQTPRAAPQHPSIHPTHSFATMSHVSALNHPTRSPCAVVPVSVCVRYGSGIWILRAIAKQGNCLFENKKRRGGSSRGLLFLFHFIFILFHLTFSYFVIGSLYSNSSFSFFSFS